jgi:hypothetical protein
MTVPRAACWRSGDVHTQSDRLSQAQAHSRHCCTLQSLSWHARQQKQGWGVLSRTYPTSLCNVCIAAAALLLRCCCWCCVHNVCAAAACPRLAGGLTEEDFIGESVREPLVSCLSRVGQALAALGAEACPVHDVNRYKAAVDGLKVSVCGGGGQESRHWQHRWQWCWLLPRDCQYCMCTSL